MTLIAIIAQSLWFEGFWSFGVTISVMAMMDSVGSRESAGIFQLSAGIHKFSAGIFQVSAGIKLSSAGIYLSSAGI